MTNALNKFRSHPSIIMIKNKRKTNQCFSKIFYISKIYERCLYDPIQVFFDSILSKYQCGFRRGYNAQHCLMTLIEKWKKSVDNGGAFGALFTDLSKAFDCLSHELLIVKLDVYGFDRVNKSVYIVSRTYRFC